MPGVDSFYSGIRFIRDGDNVTGRQLLKIALLDTELLAQDRAKIYVWLAAIAETEHERFEHFKAALNLDPHNPDASNYMNDITKPPAPTIKPKETTLPTPDTREVRQASVAPGTPSKPPEREVELPPGIFPRALGILDGSGVAGTGFFITHEGIIVTTQNAVRGLGHVTVRLDTPGYEFSGKVLRAYSEYDLAFIQVRVRVHQLMPTSGQFNIPENYILTAHPFNSRILQGRYRSSQRTIKRGWIPTTFRTLPDRGGAPVFDENNALIGMLTSNTGGTSEDVYALNISLIRERLETLFNEYQQDANQHYCTSCGKLSRAYVVNGYYCETCGAVLPYMQNVARAQQYHTFYDSPDGRRCRHCEARAGFHSGKCLRCGKQML